jgi:hypothetical protein
MNSNYINETLNEMLAAHDLYHSYYDASEQLSAFSFRRRAECIEYVPNVKDIKPDVFGDKRLDEFKRLVSFIVLSKHSYREMLSVIITDNNDMAVIFHKSYDIDNNHIMIDGRVWSLSNKMYLVDLVRSLAIKRRSKDQEEIDPYEIYKYIKEDL